MNLLKKSLQALNLDREEMIHSVTAIALKAIQAGEEGNIESQKSLELELEQLAKKREAALDAFFSQSITKAEMRQMIERYDRESAQLRSRLTAARTRVEATFNKANLELDIRAKASALLLGERASETFYKTILDQMVVYPDRRVKVRLNLLPRTWTFVLERLEQRTQNTPSVPMSVSRAFSSG